MRSNFSGTADLAEGVRRGYRGVHPDDVEFCLEVDVFPFVVVAAREGAHMVLRPVTVPGTGDR